MELTVTNRSRAYPGRSSEDSKVDDVQYVVLKVCYLCTSGSVVEYRLAKARVAGSNPVSCSLFEDIQYGYPLFLWKKSLRCLVLFFIRISSVDVLFL